jgi:transposase
MSVREAAQRLGIARNTASRWLALVDVTEPRYPKRVPAKSILEPYKDQMILWLKADLHRGKRDRRTTKGIFEGIRELGYAGSRGPVYEFCKYWREQQKTAPRHAGFVPLSFELGEAFQFDWSCEYAVVQGLRRRLDVAHIKLAVETGNQSWRFRSSSAKAKVAKPSRTKQSKGEEGTAVLTDLSTIL